jgi:hypothetical protein
MTQKISKLLQVDIKEKNHGKAFAYPSYLPTFQSLL